jgi:1-aminocyclopropane-1-carboxylate deaminase/D-cysteine desulfhydrase-like pyridoxal-dependent ACC family enzyme
MLAVAELVEQIAPPDVIVHATSSGGTQAGLVAGCRLLELPTRVIGISADDSAASLQSTIETILNGVAELLNADSGALNGRPYCSIRDLTSRYSSSPAPEFRASI